MREGIAQLAKLYPNCFRQPCQPLKIGIHKDIVARHPELRSGLIASALKTYTRSVGYLETLKAGSARIDLEGNPVGTVTRNSAMSCTRAYAISARLITRTARCIRSSPSSSGPPDYSATTGV